MIMLTKSLSSAVLAVSDLCWDPILWRHQPIVQRKIAMGSTIMATNGLRLCVILFNVTLTPNMPLCIAYINSLSMRMHVASVSNGSLSLPVLKGSHQKPEGSCFRVALEMTIY